ncbi:MAG: hypothetical protein E4G94_04375 [ANME-2 cluster archaeon]|nr:MAG: hypothetical protein E4G94_04375 [ANME-2 cluster archaeon]HUW68138.1 hypothetical protein [Candidatus Nanoarchaeia archaeon]
MSELKISDELISMIRDKVETTPDDEIGIIISISKGVAMEDIKNELIKNGLRIETMIPGPVQVVSGTISVKKISQLAKVSVVEKIEYDSKVYAL